jgi:type II secretory pathway component GspD/PulD (secretin)
VALLCFVPLSLAFAQQAQPVQAPQQVQPQQAQPVQAQPPQPVQAQPANPNLAAPQQQGGGESGLDRRIQGPVEAADIDLQNILMILQSESGLQMVLGGDVKKKVTFRLVNPTVREVLDTVLPSNGLDYYVSDSGIVQIDTTEKIRERYKTQQAELMTKRFRPNFIDVSQLLETFEGLKSPDGIIIPDPDGQQIIVTDIPEAIQSMEQLLLNLDIETETRVFDIKYGDVQEIADQLVGVINTIEGELFVNPRLNQIIITDIPDRLDRAAAIIAQLDKAIETAVIPLAFSLPEDVLPLIESFLTENGWVDYDPRTNRIIIHDIASVVQQAMDLIEQIDIPTQQVYIEADIVQIQKGKSLEFGTTASFGKDIGAGGDASAPNVSGVTDAGGYFSFNPFLATSGSGLTLMDVRQGSYRFQIDAMVKNNIAEIIASPKLLIQDGGVGSFTLGSQEPFSSRQRGYGGYGGYGGGDYYTQQFRDVGTTLYLESYISEAGFVEMYINVEDTKARRVQLSNVGEALAIDGSFIDTQVTVKTGRTVVLGGIINRQTERSQSGVPIISNIPIVGNLFRKKTSSSSKDKLLVFITPHIVSVEDPYEFSQIDNAQHIQDLQNKGATKFLDAPVDKKFLDWTNESENEQAALEAAMDEGVVKFKESPEAQKSEKPPIKAQFDSGVVRSQNKE